jgi:hypothetical protein
MNHLEDMRTQALAAIEKVLGPVQDVGFVPDPSAFCPFASLPGYLARRKVDDKQVRREMLYRDPKGDIHPHRPGNSYEQDKTFFEMAKKGHYMAIPRPERRRLARIERKRYAAIVAKRPKKEYPSVEAEGVEQGSQAVE